MAATWGLFLHLVVVAAARSATAGAPAELRTVVFDAGSTGTRIHVLRWARRAGSADALPKLLDSRTRKVEPGLSSFASAPDEAVASISPLLRFAESHVPTEERSTTMLLLYGTAGMRLLAPSAQQRVYAAVRRACAASGFAIPSPTFSTLTGDDEGFYALLALVWLEDAGRDHDARAAVDDAHVGVLDLGGSSTQIAFPRPGVSSAGDTDGLVLSVHGASLPVFTRSHLGYGSKAALLRVDDRLGAAARAMHGSGRGAPTAVAQPCFHRGYNYTRGGLTFYGTANNERCHELVAALFRPSAEPCAALNTSAGPMGCARPFERGALPPAEVRFFGLSAMFYIANYLDFRQRVPDMPMPAMYDLRRALEAVCTIPWAAIYSSAREPFTPEHKLPQRCFDGHYMLALLVDGFGFSERSAQITFAEKVGEWQPEWPYGAVLHHLLARDDASAGGAARAYVAPRPPPQQWMAGLALGVGLAFMLCIVLSASRGPAPLRAGRSPHFFARSVFARAYRPVYARVCNDSCRGRKSSDACSDTQDDSDGGDRETMQLMQVPAAISARSGRAAATEVV